MQRLHSRTVSATVMVCESPGKELEIETCKDTETDKELRTRVILDTGIKLY